MLHRDVCILLSSKWKLICLMICAQTNDALVAPLLRRNFCNLEETERILKKHQKHAELIVLYKTKGLHEKALDLLQRQANCEDSSLWGVEPTIQYLQTLGTSIYYRISVIAV